MKFISVLKNVVKVDLELPRYMNIMSTIAFHQIPRVK